NLSTKAFGTNFIQYDGGDLFAADGYTLYGDNQAKGAGNPAYNDTELDAMGNDRYYGGALDLGAIQQVISVTGTSVVFNGEYQAPVQFSGPFAWAQYSEDGETWSDTPFTRNAGTYTFWVKVGPETGGEETFQVTGKITPLKLTVTGSTVADKVYDGTADAAIIVGEIATLYDDVTVTAEGEFPSSDPGVWDVTVRYSLSGELAGNYYAPSYEILKGEIVEPVVGSLVVTTLDDVVDASDDVNSLREAILYAESFAEPVTITFADGLEGTITLTDGALVISSLASVTIDGGGAITVDADGAGRAFEINSGAATLANLSITNGNDARYGGAVYNAGDLTLDNVSISDSYSGKFGGAVYTAVNSHLTVIDSTFTDNTSKTHGGAIFVEKGAGADVSGSTFTGNSNAAYGAAIYVWNDAVANVSDSVFLGNNAPNGTLRNHGGELNLINVAVSGNDQGISSSDGGVNTAVNVTISNNFRSAVRGENDATFAFYNSILINDSDPEIKDQVGTFDLRTGATVTGDVNLSTAEFGENFIEYDGGDLFAPDGYNLWGHNQAVGVGNPAYNDSEFDANGNPRLYGGALDLGGVQQIAFAYGTTVVYNGDFQAPVEFNDRVASAQYSEDGVTWSDTPVTRNVRTYTFWVKAATATGEEEIYQVTGEIVPATITAVGSAEGKTYDGNVSATTDVTVSGVLGEDEITVTVSGEFADKAAAEGKTVNLTYVLGGAQAGNYVLSANETATADINKLQLTVSGTSVADKSYNGSTAAAITLGDVDGVVEGDDVTVTAAGAFPSADAGTYDVVVSYTISGDDAANYLAPVADTISAKINPIDFTVEFDDAEFVYSASAKSIEVTGTQTGDTILYSVDGENYSVDVPEYTNVGEYRIYAKVQRANYNDWSGSAVLKITPVTITVVGTAEGKTYDGSVDAETDVTFSGVLGEDEVTVTVSGEFVDAAAGKGKTVNLTYVYGGAQVGNYVFEANATATADIDKLQLTINGTGVADKDFDGTTMAAITLGEVAGVVEGDDVTVAASGAFPSADAGTYDVVVSYTISGDDAANYLAPVADTVSAKINPVDFTVEFEDAEIVYSASAKSIEVTGTLEGDVVLYSTDGTTYSVDVPEYTNVGEYTIFAKVQRANYNDWTGDAVLKITPATITVVGTAENKTYDGNVSATTDVTFSGVLGEDEVTVTVSGEFTDAAAGEGKTVNLTYQLGGAQAGNYVLSANETTTANIDKLRLTISGTTVADKSYNGSTAAAITLGEVAGVVGGDDVTVAASGAFPSADAGTYDVVVSYTISGDDAANYLAPVADTISAKINPIDFTVEFEDAEFVYSATAKSIEVTGTLEGDTVLYSLDGENYSVDVPEYTNVGEYTVYAKVQRANHNDWTGDAVLKITPATITAVGTAQNKTYNGNVTATTGVTFSGVMGEDVITVTVSGEFTDKAAAEGKTVNLTYVLGGAQAGNYILSANETTTANIDKLQLTISGTSVADKDYNGTTAAAITLGAVSGVIGQDKVTVAASGAFPSADVGTYDVAVSYTISGDDAGNYLAPATDTISAKIKPIDIDGLTFSGAENTYTASAQSIEVTGTQSGDTILYSTDGTTY
ncbi:MAG: hypothetical protein J6S40_01025, partial [Thermoguttaceae bacterium]|nr:hypothetical protein [Thermoguttaceae bacterium]